MKRSEMISIMQGILDVLPDSVSNRERACALLNKMEEYKMQPPPFTKMRMTTVWIHDSPTEGHEEEFPFEQTTYGQWEKE